VGRALVYGAPVIIALIVAYVIHRILSRVEHRKLIAENERLRERLENAESAISEGDDDNALKIVQYDRLLDEMLAKLASFEGNNPLDLSSNRALLSAMIVAGRPRRKQTP